MINEKVLQDVYAYIDAHQDDIVRELSDVASIKSVSDASSDVKPHGQGCRDAMACMLKKGEDAGFETHNYEHYVGCITLDNGAEDSIGMWAHLDVVPEGEGWMSDPYKPVVRDGLLFGRGVGDNKSAAIGGLYLQKAIRDLNIPMKHNLKLFLGTAEETGMADIEYYVANYPVPKFSFVPDAGFPGGCGEFGRVQYYLVSKKPLSSQVKDFVAGSVFNIIPNKAHILLEDNGQIDTSAIPEEGYSITKENGNIKIEAYGLSKHAAAPEGSVNAIHQLTKVLCDLPGLCEEDKKIFKFLTNVNNDSYGTFLGIANTDEVSGQTVSSGTVIGFKNGIVSLLNDCRHCVTNSNDFIIDTLKENSAKYDFDVVVKGQSKPYYIDKNGPIVKTITQIYREETGDAEGAPQISKGGTYAGKIPNSVAVGLVLRGGEAPDYIQPGHGSAHQPDEYISIEGYMKGIKLFAKMLLSVDEVL